MISVVLPAFNSKRSISRAIESVLSQIFTDYEIIVIDDGSTDNTADVVKKFGSKVNYIYQEHAGVSVARNTAIAAAKGQWIAFLDSDDEWLAEKLKLQMNLLQRNPNLRWCSCNWYQSFYSRRVPIGNSPKIRAALAGGDYFENYFQIATEGRCPILTTTIIVHKDIFEQLGGFEPGRARGQDVDMWWRIAHNYPSIGYIAEPLAVRYLDVENPITKKHRLETIRGYNRRELVDRHLAMAEEKGSIAEFRPYASKVMREGLVKMLYCGYKKEARDTVTQFRELFPWYWCLGAYLLTIFPKVTSVAAKSALYLVDKSGLRRQITR